MESDQWIAVALLITTLIASVYAHIINRRASK